MAVVKTVPRHLSRALIRSATSPVFHVAPAVFRNSQRGYSSGPSASNNTRSKSLYYGFGAGALALGGGVYWYTQQNAEPHTSIKAFTPAKKDYQQVYDYIARLLEEHDEYEDGSYGPVLLRLAWHASGTYDKETGTGGSNGATMRFGPEGGHGANAGLKVARDFLEPVKQHFPWISYSDLWTLAGVASIQEMQGPIIPWRPGRTDRDVAFCSPDGRLPDASKDASHIRAIFGRMGFNDQEMVALCGAHALGRCHTNRSGFEGPWTFSPTVFSNDFYTMLFNEKWDTRKWTGPKQYQDAGSKSLMMLPTDMELIRDKEFRKTAELYAKDAGSFYKDFAAAFSMLLELGVPFKQDERWTFEPQC